MILRAQQPGAKTLRGSSDHARGTCVEAAVSMVASRGERGLRAIHEPLAAFLIAVAQRGCLNPKGMVINMHGVILIEVDPGG